VGTNSSRQLTATPLIGTGTSLPTWTGATGAGNLVSTNGSGTLIDSGISPSNLVTLGGNNGYTGTNQYLNSVSIATLTAATSGANHSSPSFGLEGTYWTGSASADDQWNWQNVMGTGTNPTSTLTLTHSGSSGFSTVDIGAPLSCQPGLGDGLNAIPAGTYLNSTCRNETGLTWTLKAIRCVADAGSSTCNVSNGTGTGLLTGAITGTSTYANGTQSGTTTIAPGDFLKVTFIADGTTK
jgi:hypothetical protein